MSREKSFGAAADARTLASGDRARFACRLCGGTDLRLYYTLGNQRRFKYYKCRHCELVNYDLRDGIDQTQYEETVDPLDDGAKRNLDKDQSWRFIERYLPRPGRFLDIGSGSGRLLYLAKRAGWEARGLELSASMAARASTRIGVPVDVGDFLQMTPLKERFDLVSLRHVLEHLVDPILAMTRIKAMLNPGGHALLEFPNIKGFDKCLKRLLVDVGLHTRAFDDDFIAGHCNEFCRRSFGYLLNETGFSLVRWETYSMKPLANLLYNHFPIGNKARALIRC